MATRSFLMANGHFALILRFDEKEEYSRQFCSGRLRFTKLSRYRDLPDVDQGRLDRDEGLAASLDGSKIRIHIGRGNSKEPIIIADAKRVTVHYKLADAKILSLTVPGRESFREESHNTLRLSVNRQVQDLGEWVTAIHDVKQFLLRLDQWGKEHGHEFRLQPIEYLARDGHHLPADNVGFRKFDDYSEQLEGRILVEGLNPEEDVTTVDIGDISDCAMVLHRDDLPKVRVAFQWKRKPGRASKRKPGRKIRR